MSTDLAAKRLEMLSKAFSKTNRIGVLYNPQEPATRLEMQETEAAATMLGVTLQPLAAGHPDDLEPAFAAAQSEQNPELRAVAVQQLGVMGAHAELSQLYQKETSPDIKIVPVHISAGQFISYATARMK